MGNREYLDFLKHVAQEMQRPLDVACGSARLLKADECRPTLAEDERRELLSRLDGSLCRLKRVVGLFEDVSLYSRVKAVERTDRVLVNGLCRELVQGQEMEVLFKSGVSDDCMLVTNAACLRKLLGFLLSQACMRVMTRKDESREPLVILTVLEQTPGGQLIFAVSDTGDRPSPVDDVTVFLLPTTRRELPFLLRTELYVCQAVARMLGGYVYIDPHCQAGRRVIFNL